ncbi:MAG: hypothetical protein DDT19_01452 [Syntrophomonadaceae bacterium]|nr:hypothetical protein [Bacillota bacterium]
MKQDMFQSHMEMMALREQELEVQGIKVFRLSTTERRGFKECRRKWDFSSLSRQAIEPKQPAIALQFGVGIHYALEMFYSGTPILRGSDEVLDMETAAIVVHWRRWVKEQIAKMTQEQQALWDEQKQAIEESAKLGEGILKGYERWVAVVDITEELGFKNILYTEREFAVIVPDENGDPYFFTDANGQMWEIWLVGRLDMIVEDFDDHIWILDHKTSKNRLDAEILILDDQMTMYLWAIQQILGRPVEGCYYNVLRKKIPTVPKVLANGKALSQDKAIDTTYEVYLQAILDNGFNPAEYVTILDFLASKKTDFFERVKIRRNQHEIGMAGRLLLLEAIDMLNAPYIYPNPTRDCKWKCDYKFLCLATNRNDDVEYLYKALFQPRKINSPSVYNRENTNA